MSDRRYSFAAQGRGSIRLSKLLAGAGVGAFLVLAGTGQSFALNERVSGQVNHYVDCLTLLLTNPVEHARVCGGGKGPIPPSLQSLSTPVAGGAAVVTMAPVDPICEDDRDEKHKGRKDEKKYDDRKDDKKSDDRKDDKKDDKKSDDKKSDDKKFDDKKSDDKKSDDKKSDDRKGGR